MYIQKSDLLFPFLDMKIQEYFKIFVDVSLHQYKNDSNEGALLYLHGEDWLLRQQKLYRVNKIGHLPA